MSKVFLRDSKGRFIAQPKEMHLQLSPRTIFFDLDKFDEVVIHYHNKDYIVDNLDALISIVAKEKK